jgi:hypothetical protein
MTPVYFSHRSGGLWVAPNPIPGQDLDTLFQFEKEVPGFEHQILLLGKRARFLAMLHGAIPQGWQVMTTEQRAPWIRASDYTPGGTMRLYGDPKFDYQLRIWLHYGVWGAETKADRLGLTLKLYRTEPPTKGRKNKTTDAIDYWQLPRPELVRFLAKMGAGI